MRSNYLNLPDRSASTEMSFKIGNSVYTCRIAPAPLMCNGQTCFGNISEARREIFISEEVLPEDRASILLHELAHAQVFATGRPADDESLCDLIASVSTTGYRQLNEQGGEAVLMAMRVAELPADPMANIVAMMNAPEFELDAHEASIILSAVDREHKDGRVFDPFTLSLCSVLRRQLAGDDADFEDEGLENDRCDDEDGEEDNDDDAEDARSMVPSTGPGGMQIDLHTRAAIMATNASWLTDKNRVIQRGKVRRA
jgi:hypothetical protein